jgi:hypothetical protein
MLQRVSHQIKEGTTVTALEVTLEQEIFKGLPETVTQEDF